MYIRESDSTKHNIGEVRQAFPNMGIPVGAELSEVGYCRLVEVPRPSVDALTQVIEESWIKDGNHYQQVWSVVSLPVEAVSENLAAAIEATIKKIDNDADTIYRSVIGNRGEEYAQAELEAKAYKDSGYVDPVPSYVQSWAAATSNADQWAADDIIATSAAWRGAMSAIRANRLENKESARQSTTSGQLQTVATNWAAFVSYISGVLSV